MYRKSFVFVLLTTILAAAAYAQKVPKAEKTEKDKAESMYRIALAGSGGYLGVELKEVSSENYQELGLSEVRGVAIRKVIKDSAAQKAGLQEGDVVVEFNGERVTSTRKFTRMVREVAPDHKVNLTVVRGGSEIEIPVTMGKRKGLQFVTAGDFVFPELPIAPEPPMAPDFEFPPMPEMPVAPEIRVLPDGLKIDDARAYSFFSGRYLGVGVVSLTKQLGDYFGVEGGKGLLINDVTKDSPAERAGLRAGDVIVEIDGKEVKNHSDLFRGMRGDNEEPVVLTVVRDRARQTISVTPDKRPGATLQLKRNESITRDDSN